jgi:predicted dehydrogenase
MAAITRGKHVYTQKPLTHTVYEARTLAQAARKYKVATQMGNQGQASEATRRVCEIIQDGAIGNVRHVHVWTNRPTRRLSEVYWPQGIDRPQETPTVPETLEWDLFLGHAPVRPYNPVYHPFQWRGWWDFGTGALGDMGCHQLDTVFRALKLGHPTSFQASSSLVNKETYPAASIVEYDFPSRKGMSPVTVTWYDGGLKPPRPEELEDGLQMGSGGTLYVGDNGKILDGRLIPETRRKAYKLPEKTLARSPGHYQEWIDACKGGKPGGANFDWAGPLTEVVLLGNIALRMEMKEQVSRHKLLWNPETFKITNLPDANQFLHTEYRKGWTL